jgi:NAD(P)-dependent dehydrogenase (short-subunit alcohol dehydrogenase family)
VIPPPVPGYVAAMTSDNRERAVLTTGANSGIGLATAVELARRGYRSIGSVRSEAKAEIVRQAAAAAGVAVETVLMDVTDADRCEEVLGGLELYGLVNNAGYALVGAIEDTPDDEARRLFETMVLAPMRLARLALPGMRRNGGGRIINVSSIAGLVSAPLGGWYTGTKHAVEALSDSLRMEVARDGVKVIIIEPGGFKTGIWEDFERDIRRHRSEGSRNVDAYETFLRLQKMTSPIMGSPAQCANVIAGAIASRVPRSRYLVGVDAQWLALTNRLTPTLLQDRITRIALGI